MAITDRRPAPAKGKSGDENVVWRLYGRMVESISAAPRRAALILLLSLVPAVFLTVQFFSNVQAGLTELLPKQAPSVQALTELHRLLGGKAHLVVIAQSDDVEANHRFITTVCQPDARAANSVTTWSRIPRLVAGS